MNKLKKFLIVIMVLTLTFGITPKMFVWAAGTISVSSSAPSLKIGESVTITAQPKGPGGERVYATLTFDYTSSRGNLEFVSCSKSTYGGGDGIVTVAGSGTDSVSITLRATSAGDCYIGVTGTDAVNVSDATAEYGELTSGGVSITVENKAASGGGGGTNPGDTDPGDGTTEKKSADNSLKSLTISPGTLSPKFKYSTQKYTASVDGSVTSIAVDAQVSNEKASVVSVTGNTNLKVGENTVEITVKAEDGTTAVYKIIVTRGGTASEEPEEPKDEPTDPPTGGTSNKSIVIDGKAYKVSATLPEEELPREFIKTTATYNKQKVEAYTFHYQELMLLYLKPVSSKNGTTGSFYFYNEKADEFFPYINIDMGKTYAVILPNSFAETLPTGYEETELDIEDYSVTACRPITEDTETENEFYLVYGVDKNGNTGWYQYDSVDLSLQRFNEVENVSGETMAELSAYKEAYTNLQEKYNEERVSSRKVMAVLVVVLVIAIFAIINILLFKSGKFDKKSDDRDDDVDYVDLDEI